MDAFIHTIVPTEEPTLVVCRADTTAPLVDEDTRAGFAAKPLLEHPGMSSEFDFIVVGGGTAGCTAVGRLAENPKIRILVVETQATVTSAPSMLDRPRAEYTRVEQPNTRGKLEVLADHVSVLKAGRAGEPPATSY
ncbi:hypothetical protein GGX14DRAFT_653939, partial [Mycena pura]